MNIVVKGIAITFLIFTFKKKNFFRVVVDIKCF